MDDQSRTRRRMPASHGRINPHGAGARPTTITLLLFAALFFSTVADAATARTPFDGSWTIVFVTRRGACDPAYNFTVNISHGIVTHPNLVRFRGRVARNGSVQASVAAMDKYASGSGRLSRVSGRGIWSGHSGVSRCSGHWTAQRN